MALVSVSLTILKMNPCYEAFYAKFYMGGSIEQINSTADVRDACACSRVGRRMEKFLTSYIDFIVHFFTICGLKWKKIIYTTKVGITDNLRQ